MSGTRPLDLLDIALEVLAAAGLERLLEGDSTWFVAVLIIAPVFLLSKRVRRLLFGSHNDEPDRDQPGTTVVKIKNMPKGADCTVSFERSGTTVTFEGESGAVDGDEGEENGC